MKEIESSKYHFITNINEPEENTLEFEITGGVISDKEEDLLIGNHNIGPINPILLDENNKYKIRFERYIGYTVLNESYADKLGDDYIGLNPRIYSKSPFLDYIKEDTFACKEYPGEFKHYAFIAFNHIINVASEMEPKFEKIK